MTQIKQLLEIASKSYNEWYAKNRWVISLLGLSWSEAAFQRTHVDGIAGDVLVFSKHAKKFVAIAFLVLAALSITHSFLFLSTTKVCNLISIYFGLTGSFLAAYGFLLGLKRRDAGTKAHRNIWLPDVPTRPEDIPRYAAKMNEIVASLINTGSAEKVEQLKLELRKQFSVAIGLIMLSFSFAIQIALLFLGG